MVCKIAFCSEFPDIPDSPGRKGTKRRRKRRTQAIAKRYAFHANTIISFLTVQIDEMNNGMRHIKLCKIQSQPFAGLLQYRCFIRISLNSQKYIFIGVSFLIRFQVKFEKIL